MTVSGLNIVSISTTLICGCLIRQDALILPAADAFVNYDGPLRIQTLPNIIKSPSAFVPSPPQSASLSKLQRTTTAPYRYVTSLSERDESKIDDGSGGGGYDEVNSTIELEKHDMYETRNGSSSSTKNGVEAKQRRNGETRKPKNNGASKPENNDINPLCAPEVSEWTSIMVDGLLTNDDDPANAEVFEEGWKSVYDLMRDMTPYDNEQVELYWDKIMPTVSYLGTANVSKVKQALRVAYRAHRLQKRKSGEPFIIHPVEVSLLLSGLKMDAETVIAGLLHDTVEDTELTFAQVEAVFGSVVRSIVEGETKVSKLPKLVFSEYADEQAENLRQMFVAMTDDYRIIIVKLADRLHNMRTLRFMKPEKQIKISRETLDIFAPLAHRMGIWQFKTELEDTAFMYLYPREYKRLNRRLRRHQSQLRETLDRSQEILKKTLENDPTLRDQATEVKVCGRTKELYSLWHKMELKRQHSLDQITDVVALRVILDPKDEDTGDAQCESDRGVWLCYHVLGLVQHLPGFQPVPTKVKDYISFPKPNGYQSLHTALMLNGQTVEVQIRTSAMHQVAEYGMASHWAYTDEKRRGGPGLGDELYNTPWLESIKEWQQDFICSRDFVECVRRELLGKRVFVFLRNGKILNLVRGSTVIDAAFQIHTEVGLTMHGVEINGRPVPFSYELRNGDVVSILTGMGTPATDWMRFAKSRSTRSKLRSYFRSKQRESLREAGKILLTDFLEMHKDLLDNRSYLEGKIPQTIDEITEVLPGKTRYAELDDLLIEIGKRHDRDFLRSVASKLFRVPLAALVEAEEQRGQIFKKNIYAAVNENRKNARDAGEAVMDNPDYNDIYEVGILTDTTGVSTNTISMITDNATETTFDNDGTFMSGLFTNQISVEFADPEHLCRTCLPIIGDDIIGTKPISKDGIPDGAYATTVHRQGCVHAQRALNRGLTKFTTNNANGSSKRNGNSNTDSSANDRDVHQKRFRHNKVKDAANTIPVKLRWSEYDMENPNLSYVAEVVIVANDRKLLLADCSEIVSEIADIVKTGSMTTNEHATLEFVVKVNNLDHLQNLMDSLSEVPSVMSVERRFGAELL